MTCILGIHDPAEGTVIAADGRQMLNHSTIVSDEALKIDRCGPWILGVSGHSAVHVVIEEMREELAAAATPAAVGRALRDGFKRYDWKSEGDDSGPPNYGQSIMLGRADGLWLLPCNLAPGPIPERRPFGVGSGSEWAEGAAFEALRRGASLAEAARSGVEAAIAYDSGCGGAVWVARASTQQALQALDDWLVLSAGVRKAPTGDDDPGAVIGG